MILAVFIRGEIKIVVEGFLIPFQLTLTSTGVSIISGTLNLHEGSKIENIKSIRLYVVVNQKFNNPNIFILWDYMLGQFGLQ